MRLAGPARGQSGRRAYVLPAGTVRPARVRPAADSCGPDCGQSPVDPEPLGHGCHRPTVDDHALLDQMPTEDRQTRTRMCHASLGPVWVLNVSRGAVGSRSSTTSSITTPVIPPPTSAIPTRGLVRLLGRSIRPIRRSGWQQLSVPLGALEPSAGPRRPYESQGAWLATRSGLARDDRARPATIQHWHATIRPGTGTRRSGPALARRWPGTQPSGSVRHRPTGPRRSSGGRRPSG